MTVHGLPDELGSSIASLPSIAPENLAQINDPIVHNQQLHFPHSADNSIGANAGLGTQFNDGPGPLPNQLLPTQPQSQPVSQLCDSNGVSHGHKEFIGPSGTCSEPNSFLSASSDNLGPFQAGQVRSSARAGSGAQ